jgi:hypothetical protein
VIAKSPLHREGAGSTAAAGRRVASVAEITAPRTLHDPRHSGLTWSARTADPCGAYAAGGPLGSQASIRYQHATRESGRGLADDLDNLT